MKNMNRYLSLVALIISLISCQSEDNPNRYELCRKENLKLDIHHVKKLKHLQRKKSWLN